MMVDSGAVPNPAPGEGVRRWRRWVWLGVLVVVLGPLIAVGHWHSSKPLPAGVRVASAWSAAPADDVRLLLDVTAADAYGRPVVQQQIFDESLRMIAAARDFIVLDQFLFNAHQGSLEPATDSDIESAAPLRSLSRELREALIVARRDQPQLRVLFITDPINDVYGGAPSPDLDALRTAGIDVVVTDLDQLRDPNPIYSSLWRIAIRWWSGDGAGPGWLPNPLAEGPQRVTFRAWARLLNMKANHRKVLITDDGAGGLIGIVGSMNPHDASSAHSNTALQVRGAALAPLLASELALARGSGWRSEWPLPVAATTPPLLAAKAVVPPGGATLRVRTLTEGAIRDALLEQIALAGRDDRIDLAMFYLSERRIIDALVAAAARGVAIRVLLDPNRDAFGRKKNGIPNRPVASELVTRSDGAIKLRWYRTHGEQFHSKLFALHQPQRSWLTTGSANLTRRNVADFNLEANLAIEAPPDADVVLTAAAWFETLWSNRASVGIEYSTDFGTFADPAQSSYWAYRIMEATGLSSF